MKFDLGLEYLFCFIFLVLDLPLGLFVRIIDASFIRRQESRSFEYWAIIKFCWQLMKLTDQMGTTQKRV